MILYYVPVEALLRYLHLRGSNPGPLFVFENGSPLTRVKLSSVISSLLKVCNIEGDYTGHSFRIGAAITAARVGIPDNMIKLQVVGLAKLIGCT